MSEHADDPDRFITANPARRFFVGMLVKDIELVPAILDLVDNSVDGAKRLRPATQAEADGVGPEVPTRRFAGLHVRITVDGERFEIDDNCGGIPLEAARDYAFRFGRPDKLDGPLADIDPIGAVGQFGVGMKRALFKLGTWFEVTSMSHHDSFTLPVDVTRWVTDPAIEWSFELRNFEEDLDLADDETGTNIVVKPLHVPIAEETGDPTFPGRLLNELRLRHSEAVRQGLTLEVNGTPVEGFEPALLRGEDFEPIHLRRNITVDEDLLRMRLYAGLVRLREDGTVDDDDAEQFRAPPDAGWYLYCNDRLLLAGHTGRLTGWGEAAAAYHPQYRQFRGYVWLDGDAALMPWTTTKTSVDEDSPVFRRVQAEMFDALQKTQKVMNRLKVELGSSNDERPAVEAMAAAAPVALTEIPPSARFVLPPPAPKTPSTVRNITYQVDRDDFDLVAGELGTRTAADVGRRTFDFFLKNQVNA